MQETQETWVPIPRWEDPLKEGMQPTPVFLPGEFHLLTVSNQEDRYSEDTYHMK